MALSAPIELNNDELLAVSGGAVVAVGILQAISQGAAVVQNGGFSASRKLVGTSALAGTAPWHREALN
jgi:hypothetical protein